jgi:hypothetical protein
MNLAPYSQENSFTSQLLPFLTKPVERNEVFQDHSSDGPSPYDVHLVTSVSAADSSVLSYEERRTL